MATLAPPIQEPAPSSVPDGLWRLSVEQYHAMIAAGIFESGEPVELLSGLLVEKTLKSPQHTAATRLIRRAIFRSLPVGWEVDSQEPVTTSDSEPEPDVLVFRGDVRDFTERHPGPSEIGLVVEVSDSSLSRDRGLKRKIYAQAEIPFYWVANLVSNRFEVFAAPANGDYASRQDFGPGQAVPLILDGAPVASIAVNDMLP